MTRGGTAAGGFFPFPFGGKTASGPFRVGVGVEPIDSENRRVGREGCAEILSLADGAFEITGGRRGDLGLVRPAFWHMGLAGRLERMGDLGTLFRVALEVIEELLIFGNRDFVFGNIERRKAGRLALEVEWPGGNFHKRAEIGDLDLNRRGPHEKPEADRRAHNEQCNGDDRGGVVFFWWWRGWRGSGRRSCWLRRGGARKFLDLFPGRRIRFGIY